MKQNPFKLKLYLGKNSTEEYDQPNLLVGKIYSIVEFKIYVLVNSEKLQPSKVNF